MGINIPPEVQIWRFGGKTGNVRSQNTYTNNAGYNLFCQGNSSHLTYVDQAVGMNLGFEKAGHERKVWLRLPDGQERDILTGEPFAFGIGGGKAFMKYVHRTAGINLEFVSGVPYEWRMYLPGGEDGQPIPTGAMVAIVNDRVEPARDFLVHLDRAPGQADVGWTSSSNWWGNAQPAIKLAIEAFKFAQNQ